MLIDFLTDTNLLLPEHSTLALRDPEPSHQVCGLRGTFGPSEGLSGEMCGLSLDSWYPESLERKVQTWVGILLL